MTQSITQDKFPKEGFPAYKPKKGSWRNILPLLVTGGLAGSLMLGGDLLIPRSAESGITHMGSFYRFLDQFPSEIEDGQCTSDGFEVEDLSLDGLSLSLSNFRYRHSPLSGGLDSYHVDLRSRGNDLYVSLRVQDDSCSVIASSRPLASLDPLLIANTGDFSCENLNPSFTVYHCDQMPLADRLAEDCEAVDLTWLRSIGEDFYSTLSDDLRSEIQDHYGDFCVQ